MFLPQQARQKKICNLKILPKVFKYGPRCESFDGETWAWADVVGRSDYKCQLFHSNGGNEHAEALSEFQLVLVSNSNFPRHVVLVPLPGLLTKNNLTLLGNSRMKMFQEKTWFFAANWISGETEPRFFLSKSLPQHLFKVSLFRLFVNYFKVWSLNELRSNKIQRSVASERPVDQLNCCRRDEIDRSLRRGGRDTKTGQRCRWPPTSRVDDVVVLKRNCFR